MKNPLIRELQKRKCKALFSLLEKVYEYVYIYIYMRASKKCCMTYVLCVW